MEFVFCTFLFLMIVVISQFFVWYSKCPALFCIEFELVYFLFISCSYRIPIKFVFCLLLLFPLSDSYEIIIFHWLEIHYNHYKKEQNKNIKFILLAQGNILHTSFFCCGNKFSHSMSVDVLLLLVLTKSGKHLDG